MGERKSITYPNGNKAIYEYDEMLRLQKMRIRRSEGLEWISRTSDDFQEICYKYDATGRISEKLFPEEMRTRWLYDERGQLVELLHEDRHGVLDRYQYEHDSMGNKTAITKDRRGLREESGRYEYGAMNRLSKSWNDKRQEVVYLYNGLGQRKGRNADGGEDDYLLDLTRTHHNLLEIKGTEKEQIFYFDGDVTTMDERGKSHYYLLDELGSPMRVSGFREKEDLFTGNRDYLTYGYDEFGNDLGRELEEVGIPSPYGRQGVEQPFGYTGYRYDKVSGTYFAQAREYQPKSGRFTAEDVVKGNGVVPETLNQYEYCLNNSLRYVDLNGREEEEYTVYYLNNNFWIQGI